MRADDVVPTDEKPLAQLPLVQGNPFVSSTKVGLDPRGLFNRTVDVWVELVGGGGWRVRNQGEIAVWEFGGRGMIMAS